MSIARFLFSAAVAIFLAAAFVAPAPAQPYCGAGYGNGIMGFLTPEQRVMHFGEVQRATAGMSFDDMRRYRLDLRSKVMAMTAAERRKFADDLFVKWNAMSTDEKVKLQHDFIAYRGSGRWGAGIGMGRGMGMGQGMSGCWW